VRVVSHEGAADGMTKYLRPSMAVAEYGLWPTAEAFRKWVKRGAIPHSHEGRKMIVPRASIDAAIQRGRRRRYQIGPCGPNGRLTTKATHLSSPRGLGNVAPVGPIASFDATSTDVSSRAGSSACGNPATTLGVHPQTGRRAGNYRRVS
jgi:hypothetical protein